MTALPQRMYSDPAVQQLDDEVSEESSGLTCAEVRRRTMEQLQDIVCTPPDAEALATMLAQEQQADSL